MHDRTRIATIVLWFLLAMLGYSVCATPIASGVTTEAILAFQGDGDMYSITVPGNHRVVFTITRSSQSASIAAYMGNGFEPSNTQNTNYVHFDVTNPLNSNTLTLSNDESYSVIAYILVENRQNTPARYTLRAQLTKSTLMKEGAAIFLGVIIPVACCCILSCIAAIVIGCYVQKRKRDRLNYNPTPPTPIHMAFRTDGSPKNLPAFELFPETPSATSSVNSGVVNMSTPHYVMYNPTIASELSGASRDSGVPMIANQMYYPADLELGEDRSRSDSSAPLHVPEYGLPVAAASNSQIYGD